MGLKTLKIAEYQPLTQEDGDLRRKLEKEAGLKWFIPH
jgi:hypothetical protein